MMNPDDNPNRWLAEEIKNEKNIKGFGTIDFTKDNLTEQVSEIHSLGLLGIKIHPAHQKISVNGEMAYKVYEKAQELGLFITFHTGVHRSRLSDYAQLLFYDVAFSFPTLKFSMEHIGGYCFFKESVAVMSNQRDMRTKPRVFAGWTSIYEKGLWYISDTELNDLLHITGDNPHIFGLDFPYNDAEYIKKSINRVLALEISDESKQKILGGNLCRELNIEL